jgi:multiple sugar transport system permease protein
MREAGLLGSPDSLPRRIAGWFGWFLPRLAVLVMIVYVVGPFVWMFLSSFETRAQLFSRPPTWVPPSLYLGNYQAILGDATLIPALRNSAVVATFTAVAALSVGSLAAYAFARLRLPGRDGLFVLVLVT